MRGLIRGMREYRTIALLAALVAGGLAGGARADNNVCLAFGGDWKATGAVKSVIEFQGVYSIEFSSQVIGESLVKTKSALQPTVTGDCLIGWAAGFGPLPATCKEGSAATASGRLSFDDAKVAGVNVAEPGDLTCE